MKKLITYLLASFIFLAMPGGTSFAAGERSVTIYLNNDKIAFTGTDPVIAAGRVLVPVRGFFEKIGVAVDWNQTSKLAIIKDDKREIMLELGSRTALNNGVAEYLDCGVTLRNDHAMIPLRYIAESFGYNVTWDQKTLSVHVKKGPNPAADSSGLPRINDLETLYQLLRYSDKMRGYLRYDVIDVIVDGAASVSEAVDSAPVQQRNDIAEKSAAAAEDYSGTNNQVEGVEEGDIVKTDGRFIYAASGNVLRIIDADPSDLRVLSKIPCAGGISEIYVYANRLIIINGSSHLLLPRSKYADLDDKMFGDRTITSTNVKTYDIGNPEKPKLLQDMDYEGTYVSSRMIGDNVYIVTNAVIYFFNWYLNDDYTDLFCKNDKAGFKRVLDEDVESKMALLRETGCKTADELFVTVRAILEESVSPRYADNRTGSVSRLKLKDIPYFPDMIMPNYLMTIGIDLSGGRSEVKAYLGSSEELYVSAGHLYTALSAYDYNAVHSKLEGYPYYDLKTSVYRFGLENGRIAYEAGGKVPGRIVDQFSMDEYEGTFRIATTTEQQNGRMGSTGNNVYILNEKLAITGRLEDIAEGERIYSTRFAGDRIYMVTFRQIDPFFVIDASNPKKPSVLGYLKIPGFSTYMHILDDGHVLGFGFDTKGTGAGAIRTGGFKLSLFDVTDVSYPKEVKNEVIGEMSSSALENDHKALMISLDKGIMGFPIVCENTDDDYFAGFYIYKVSSDDFTYYGRVSHIPANTARDDAREEQFIERGIYIGNYLYTFSREKMEVHSLQTLKKAGSLKF